ncbi:MAG: response regulator [Hyphomicrobium sp.]|jgi:DNA-binding response OmpR family regulator
MRVLLVEDELLISMMLEDELALLGHCVAGVATTVEGGLALLQQTASPDFALVDFQLADGECHELIADLKMRRIPFALVTGAQIDKADARIGNIDVLTKPLDLDRLTAVLNRFTSSSERGGASVGGRASFQLSLAAEG